MNLSILDVLKTLEKAHLKSKTHYNLQFNSVTKGITLDCLDDYNVAPCFRYNGEFRFLPSDITHDIAQGMIDYIKYHSKGVKKLRTKAHIPSTTKSKVSSVLMAAHRTAGIDGVNTLIMAGIK